MFSDNRCKNSYLVRVAGRKYLFAAVCTIALAAMYASCATSTYMGRWLKWRASDTDDYQRFPCFQFKASANPFHFSTSSHPNLGNLKVTTGKGRKAELETVLNSHETTAFIVIRNDSILYEGYYNGSARHSVNTTFSVAKSITALLLGVAVDEQLVTSLSDPVTKYLPLLAATDPLYQNVRIDDLLDMRSGIQFRDHDLPWGDKPKAYYCPQLRKRIAELPVNGDVGGRFKYNSYNPIVIGMILEKVTGMPPARYFEQKLWNKLGMEYDGSWSADSDLSMMTKMESGINLRAIDFAKFGRLLLKKGNWEGEQVVSKAWIDGSTKIDPAHQLSEFGPEIYYENFWWLYSSDHRNAYIISGWGHLGQYLYVFPENEVIIVRMGKEVGGVESWGKIFKEVTEFVTLH